MGGEEGAPSLHVGGGGGSAPCGEHTCVLCTSCNVKLTKCTLLQNVSSPEMKEAVWHVKLACHHPAMLQEVYLGTVQSLQDAFYGVHHRFNTVSKVYLGSMFTIVLIGWDPAPPPHIWAHTRGRYWSAKIDDISLWPPGDHAVVNVWMTDNVSSIPVGSVKNLCQDSSVWLRENEWRK